MRASPGCACVLSRNVCGEMVTLSGLASFVLKVSMCSGGRGMLTSPDFSLREYGIL